MPNPNHLRFPSGTTLEQAKKDAHSMAKAENIKLSAAQDKIAKQNGLGMRWSKAVKWMKDQQSGLLASFSLPTREGHHHKIDLDSDKPGIAIIAGPGYGKTHCNTQNVPR